VFYGGPQDDILKKIRKKEDTKMFEFLLSYRSKKKRKQVSDSIIISIHLNFNEQQFYHDFLRQVFEQIFKRVARNSTESIYKHVIKEIKKKKCLFKKFLLYLKMFYFSIFRKESIFEKIFKKKIDNFEVVFRELTTKRCKIYSRKREKIKSSLVIFNPLGSIEKVELIKFSEESMDRKIFDIKNTIEFRAWNFLHELFDKGKRVYFGTISRFCKCEIENNIIVDEVL
jgi:hypothetical protein